MIPFHALRVLLVNGTATGVTHMCTMEDGTLTLGTLLQDPLTRMLMQRDGVSEREFSELMLRVQNVLADRALCAPTRYEAPVCA